MFQTTEGWETGRLLRADHLQECVSMLKVYIAAPFPMKSRAVELMEVLEAAGYPVTSTWLRVNDMPDSDAAARLDLADVRKADVLLAFNPPGWERQGTGGRHCELGSALTLGLPVILLGPRTNTFHFHSDVEAVEHVTDVLDVLARHAAALTVARA